MARKRQEPLKITVEIVCKDPHATRVRVIRQILQMMAEKEAAAARAAAQERQEDPSTSS